MCEEEECAVLLVARVKRWVGGGGAAAQAHADVAAIGDRLEELWLQTLALQEFNQHLGGACLISWRVDALGANQLHQILRRFGADLLEECWINGGGGEPFRESLGGGCGEL